MSPWVDRDKMRRGVQALIKEDAANLELSSPNSSVRDLRWETGLSADFEWVRRVVSPWEPDTERPEHPCKKKAESA